MGSFWNYFNIVLGVLSALTGIASFVLGYYKLNDQGVVGVFFIGLIAVWFLVQNIFLTAKYRKYAGYAEIFDEINLGFSALHEIEHEVERELSVKEITQRLENLCTHLATGFKQVKGHRCGVCIKIISYGKDPQGKEQRPKARTLCRDEYSNKSQTRPSGDTDRLEHWLDQNTDFKFILKTVEDHKLTPYYLGNDLPLIEGYENTRLPVTGWPPKRLFLIGRWNRIWNWPLTYKSTLVVPLLPLDGSSHTMEKVRGFLCIDSERRVAFNKQQDVEILRGVADGLYSKIDKLRKRLPDV